MLLNFIAEFSNQWPPCLSSSEIIVITPIISPFKMQEVNNGTVNLIAIGWRISFSCGCFCFCVPLSHIPDVYILLQCNYSTDTGKKSKLICLVLLMPPSYVFEIVMFWIRSSISLLVDNVDWATEWVQSTIHSNPSARHAQTLSC